MAEHMNAFQGLVHQTTTLEVPLVDEVLALFLLGSLPETWETLVVTAGPVWGRETGQDRCRGLGSYAHEDNNIHSMLHPYELVQ